MIIILLISGVFMVSLQAPILYKAHEITGLFVLPLVIVRLLWCLYNKSPGYNYYSSKGIVRYIHLLYILMIITSLTALIAFNIWELPIPLFKIPLFFDSENMELAENLIEVHKFLSLVLGIMLYMYVCAILNRCFLEKVNAMIKMLPFIKVKNSKKSNID
jgi:cytochrome b561